ncbi:hypothetical protein A9Q81_22585 [Gammaproteobacteria bacterium 42_54_T18]|nr:hypothetical protein A9Q81_22585 [Gammaproteobacteria bacterium 42_54_T18]
MKQIILRTLGVVVGLAMIIAGISVLINPIFDNLNEKLSYSSQILIGSVFVFYGVTGAESIRQYINKRKQKK